MKTAGDSTPHAFDDNAIEAPKALEPIQHATLTAAISPRELTKLLNNSDDGDNPPDQMSKQIQIKNVKSNFNIDKEFKTWFRGNKYRNITESEKDADFLRLQPETQAEKFVMKTIKHALHDKRKARAEIARTSNMESEAKEQITAMEQLIKDIDQKRKNSLMVSLNDLKHKKKKFDEAGAELKKNADLYQRDVDKGMQEQEAVMDAADYARQVEEMLDEIQEESKHLKWQKEKQIATATTAATKAAEYKKVANNVDTVLKESSNIEKLKHIALEATASKNRLKEQLHDDFLEEYVDSDYMEQPKERRGQFDHDDSAEGKNEEIAETDDEDITFQPAESQMRSWLSLRAPTQYSSSASKGARTDEDVAEDLAVLVAGNHIRPQRSLRQSSKRVHRRPT